MVLVARAVTRKTPIYFIYFSANIMDISFWTIMSIVYLVNVMEVDIEATNRVNSVRLREACP